MLSTAVFQFGCCCVAHFYCIANGIILCAASHQLSENYIALTIVEFCLL